VASAIPVTEDFGNAMLLGFEEVNLPAAVDLWPSAPGWKYVAGVLTALFLVYGFRRARRWWRNRYRRAALRELRELEQRNTPDVNYRLALATLVKSTALQIYPRKEIASLNGRPWIEFLNAQADAPLFDGCSLFALGDGIYQPERSSNADETEHLFAQVRGWLKQHPLPQRRMP
jgi:hypothetical protein